MAISYKRVRTGPAAPGVQRSPVNGTGYRLSSGPGVALPISLLCMLVFFLPRHDVNIEGARVGLSTGKAITAVPLFSTYNQDDHDTKLGQKMQDHLV